MESWRDEASEETQGVLDALFSDAVDLAVEQVGKYGSFPPFAMTRSTTGEGGLVVIDEDDGEELIRMLWNGARRDRAGLAALAVVADVRLADTGSDAIRIQLEHRDGTVVEIAAPYRRKRLSRQIVVGEPFLGDAERRVW